MKFKQTLLTAALLLPLHFAYSQERSVYFPRVSGDGNLALSAVPVNGPATAVTDITTGVDVTFGTGLASNGLGSLFYSDNTGNQIIMTDKAGKKSVVVNSSLGLNNPLALTFDPVGKFLYILDSEYQRIVRANLASGQAASSLETVIVTTSVIYDINFNPRDGKLYWTDSGTLMRADLSAADLPLTSAETFFSTMSGLYGFFDFDDRTPQNIYLVDASATEGIRKAAVPSAGETSLFESTLRDISSLEDYFILGIAVDLEEDNLCYTGLDNALPFLICTDTGFVGPEVDLSSLLLNIPVHLLIEKSPALVKPNTQPAPPAVTVLPSQAKPQVKLTFESFIGVEPSKSFARFLAAAKKKAGGKVSFQYSVEIKRPTDALGSPIKKKLQDLRKLTTKKNELTVKNLKGNSNYEVRYRVEITKKSKDFPVKVIKKTPFSPTVTFTIN